MNFKGRWVLVTGASSGLGREMAMQLAVEHGANLVLVARRQKNLEELEQLLRERSRAQVVPLVADLTDLAQVDRVVREAQDGRPLYGAVLNAGVTYFGAHERMDWRTFDTMLQTNVVSVVRMTNALLPALEPNRGGLMIVSSMAGLTPVPYQTAYSGTKAFLVNFGVGLSHELHGRDVSVTTYAPGGIQTEMTSSKSFDALRGWLMPVDRAAREGIEAMRQRRCVRVPSVSNRLGLHFMRLIPGQFLNARVAATYRRALALAGHFEDGVREAVSRE